MKLSDIANKYKLNQRDLEDFLDKHTEFKTGGFNIYNVKVEDSDVEEIVRLFLAEQAAAKASKSEVEKIEEDKKLLITTTQTVDNFTVSEYLGIVSGSATISIDMLFYGGITKLDSNYNNAFDKALKIINDKALSLNSDAIIGLQSTITHRDDVTFLLFISGTAVKLEESGNKLPELPNLPDFNF